MDIRAAQADRRYPQTDLSSGRAYGRFAMDPHVTRGMQPGDLGDLSATLGHRGA